MGASPFLVVTVDTEEEGLWSGRYLRHGNSCRNVSLGLPRLQNLCESFGIRPTYLVDAAVLDDVDAVRFLDTVHQKGGCEIGAHCHPWCNPPYEEEPSDRNSFLCNLPENLQRAKLKWLTDRITKLFGVRPTSFRAGRYGLDHRGFSILNELGYLVDSSVLPFKDDSLAGGRNFERAPFVPYIPSADDLCRATETLRQNGSCSPVEGSMRTAERKCCHATMAESYSEGSSASSGTKVAQRLTVEIPISTGYTRVPFSRVHRLRRYVEKFGGRLLRLLGILDRLNICRFVKFSPEQAGISDLRRLVDNYLQLGAPVMVLMFHSSSLLPGMSPYVASVKDLECFCKRLEQIYEYCLVTKSMQPATLTETACTLSALSRISNVVTIPYGLRA